MKRQRKEESFIKKPVYPGGPRALKAFVTGNLKYPTEALERKIEGTVHLRYTINHKGVVVSSKIIAGLGHGCDEEADRLVKLLQFEVPKNRGVRVQFHKTLRIHFRLPASNPEPQPGGFQYTYTAATSKPKEAPAEKGGYSYTIKF